MDGWMLKVENHQTPVPYSSHPNVPLPLRVRPLVRKARRPLAQHLPPPPHRRPCLPQVRLLSTPGDSISLNPGLSRFSDLHHFRKPNDLRALELMDRAAKTVMDEYPDVVLGFGESDEYRSVCGSQPIPCRMLKSIFRSFSSFLIRRAATLYSRRESKIVSLLVSLFTSAYVYHWPTYFPPTPPDALKPDEVDPNKLLYPPTFDGRIVCYPSPKEVRDYFSWRQVDSSFSPLPFLSQ